MVPTSGNSDDSPERAEPPLPDDAASDAPAASEASTNGAPEDALATPSTEATPSAEEGVAPVGLDGSPGSSGGVDDPQGGGGDAPASGEDGSNGDYYVAVDGNDDNPGSIDQPFATMQRAIDVAEAGDLVYVRGGLYEIVQGARPWAGIYFHESGTSAEERIRYFAYPGEHPIFDFENLQLLPDPDYTTGVVVEGAWLHLKGFEIRNVPMNTRSNTGLGVRGGAHHDIFELLDLHHNFGSGMFINTTTGGHEIINCDSHDSVAWGNRASGFYANHSAGGNDWFNNTSYDNGTQFNMLASSWDASGNRTDGVILTGTRVHVMRNNVSFPWDNTNMAGVDSQFNSWDLGITPSQDDFSSVSDAGLIGTRNPDGSLPSLNFMKLGPNSQMIDVGTDVGTPFNGGAPDLGAYER